MATSSGSRAQANIYTKWSDAEETMFSIAMGRYLETDPNTWEKAAAMIRTRSPTEVQVHFMELQQHNPQQQIHLIPVNVEAGEPPIDHTVKIEGGDNAVVLGHMLQEQQQQNQGQQADPWLVKKRLTKADVKERLLIRNADFNTHLRPSIDALNPGASYAVGVPLTMCHVHNNNRSMYYVTVKKRGRRSSYVVDGDAWIEGIVRPLDLKLYDVIGFCWDGENNMLNFSILHRNYDVD